MTFENRVKRQISPDKLNADVTNPAKDGALPGQIDKEELASGELAQTTGTPDNPQGSIDLAGGQPRNDESGIDISKFTGPGSKTSSQLEAENSPTGTGPGNGVAQDRLSTGGEWENPEPENDSF